MLSRKIPKLKLWSRLGLRSKGSSNTKQHSIRSNSSCYNNNAITTTSFYKALSIRSREFGNYAVQGIPVLSIFALVGIVSYTIGITSFDRSTDSKQKAYAAESTTSTTASGTSSTSASLIVDNNTFYDNIDAEYGTTNYASHKVTISADNIDGYTLTITGPTNLTAPNGNNATTSDVTKWGYAWGAENATESSLTYNNFTGTTQNLETNTGITNNSVNLTKKLAFAATFTNNASDGHYKGTVGLGLTVTPRMLNILEQISLMQQMTPDICNAAKVGDTAILIDGRDGSEYTIRKHDDNKCWMTQNLRIIDKNITLNDSDVVANFTIPASDITKFGTSNNSDSVYYGNNTDYGAYYSWYTATAGTGTQAITSGEATSSICPRGWKLPSSSDYGHLATAIGAGNNAAGSVIFRNDIYRFQYAGYIYKSSFEGTVGANGCYWSRTAMNANNAYRLGIDKDWADPTSGELKYVGFSVRCVANDTKYTYRVSYKLKDGHVLSSGGSNALPSDDVVVTSDTAHVFTVQNPPAVGHNSSASWCIVKDWLGSDGVVYKPGDKITLTATNSSITLTTNTTGTCY